MLPYVSAPALLLGLGGGIDIFGGKTGNGSEGWNPADPGAFHYSPSEEQTGAVVTAADIEALFCPGTGRSRRACRKPGRPRRAGRT